jgi:uncharacterized membrane protein YgcG
MKAFRRPLAVLLVLLASLAPAGAVERILLFVSDVVVERNGDLLVTETIRVNAEGREIRRGILRDFPTTYSRADGSRVVVGFHLISVSRDGEPETWGLEGLSNGVRIRIGQADRTLRAGQHEYVIRYRTTRQIGFFSGYDELYWNATGNGWTFAIDQAEARIRLPAEVPFKQTAFYTGPQGARGKDATIVEQRPGRIAFRTTRPLPARHGLTVAAAWEKGLIAPPTAAQQATYWLSDNRGLAAAVAGLGLIVAFYGLAWSLVGRDPQGGTIIPLFGPPTGMSPAAARFVDRMGFDDRCFTAAIVNLGVHRRIKIVDDGDTTTLQQRSGGREVVPEERAMEQWLFSAGRHSLLLDQANHATLGGAKDALKEKLQEQYLGKLFATNFLWSGLGLGLFVALLAVVVVLVALAHQDHLLAGLLLCGLFAVPFAMGGGAMIFSGWQRSLGGGLMLVSGFVVLALALAGGMFAVWYNAPGQANLVLAVTLLAGAALVGAGFPWLKAPSRSGRKAMDDIEGFRQYLGVAEEDRLNALNPPEKTPELFERFLPYAIALDVQNEWARRFAGVLAAAGAAAATSAWYQGSRDWSDPVSFADHLGSELSQTVSSASTAPGSSSGSGGGGSSGGGGGGGGGSGW